MKSATVKKQSVARELTKCYLRLLTKAVNKVKMVDSWFFEESEDDSEVRPYFYGSLVFGIIIAILIIWRSI